MKLNQAGIDLVKSFEGLYLHAYPDPGTGGDPITIGYGTTGPDIHRGMVVTKEWAEARLASDLHKFSEGVAKLVHVKLNDNQFSALVSFAYNCGLHNLAVSTLLRDVNAGKFHEAADQFLVWTHAAGHVMAGLVRRRHAERELFLKA